MSHVPQVGHASLCDMLCSSHQACSVDFDIGDSEDASYSHNIRASLNPQGHRIHQIDGKLKTALQVKVRQHCKTG